MHAAWSRGGELDQIGNRSCTPFLRHADQREQDLGGRFRVGQRTMTRPRVSCETVRERCEVRRLPAEQPPREPDRVDDRCRNPVAGEPHRPQAESSHEEIVGDQQLPAEAGRLALALP